MALIEITDSNFEREVIDSDKPVLLDFWAVWCGPCKHIAPVVEEIAKDFAGRLKVGKVDVDTNPEISMKFGVRSIPTLMIFKGGKVVEQVIGAVHKRNLLDKVTPHIEAN
ncbi:MAG: thioredoxin [Bacteroidetes bacterium]|jgi:thioredoxin 1|nr:thioredoxin [Bacteroidota bacterium]